MVAQKKRLSDEPIRPIKTTICRTDGVFGDVEQRGAYQVCYYGL